MTNFIKILSDHKDYLKTLKSKSFDAIKKSVVEINGLNPEFKGVTIEVSEDEGRDSQSSMSFVSDITFHIGNEDYSGGDSGIPGDIAKPVEDLEEGIYAVGKYLGYGEHKVKP